MRQKRKRSCHGGTSMAEIGPALFILIVAVMIPLLDLMLLSMSYAAGWYLNHLVTRECAVHDPTTRLPTDPITVANANPIILTDQIPTAVGIADSTWKKSMLCGLAQAQNSTSTHKVTFIDTSNTQYVSSYSCDGTGVVTLGLQKTPAPAAVAASAGPPAVASSNVVTCNVQTQVTVKPIFVVPFIGNVPGLSAPITFTYAGQRPQEEKGIR